MGEGRRMGKVKEKGEKSKKVSRKEETISKIIRKMSAKPNQKADHDRS